MIVYLNLLVLNVPAVVVLGSVRKEVLTAPGPFCGKTAARFSDCMFVLNKEEAVL